MATRTKIKVDRLELISQIEAKSAEEKAAYEAAVADYPRRVKAYNASLVKALKAGCAEVAAATKPVSHYDLRSLVDVEDEWPDKPSKPKDRSMAIKQLKLSTDETISLSVSDLEAYL